MKYTKKYSYSCLHTHIYIQAAEKLAQEGIQAEVINMRSIRPIDVKTIADSVRTLVCVCVCVCVQCKGHQQYIHVCIHVHTCMVR
jgi:pyruvate/2-oxoglutarate/acetoin dehydrogenase E1 component